MKRVLLALLLSGSAFADEAAVTLAQQAQLETLRGEVAGQIQLQAYDLLDELVFGWIQAPPFGAPTAVVLADVSVPVGFGSGLQALIENHFAGLVLKNPGSKLILAHCPQCTALVVHSGAKGTIVSRGVDEPEALAAAGSGSGSKHALFLDFEAEGAALVLRARITSLEPALPIVYAKTVTTSTSSAAMLRSPEHLKSAAEARQEYLDLLTGRSAYLIPIHIGVRTYASPNTGASVMVPPFVWISGGVEAALTQARAWTASLSGGVSWAPDLHVGLMAQARVARLISGASTSMTHPDLYAFIGGSVIFIHGRSAQLFQNKVIDFMDLIDLTKGQDTSTTFGTFHLGFELRVKNRVGVTVFMEALPGISDPQAMGSYIDLGFIKFRSLGVEVSFCF